MIWWQLAHDVVAMPGRGNNPEIADLLERLAAD